eukprot:CAMPEP_0197657118 /NCGR_PEP_ID=MMETSP1338-20131121/44437_1 /TAXON_ID=43686 ORGANISM="Pelagodinium beii, Strain RCC1491" /NCGR_SAMPLE_ID=MMETSP1338 /ASSEMBLY_ACC=CAM_ASM_000754 /LENGTH=226 /DNA_ID=CAMNT_0043233421 /DNA_START=32 /DNA_END=712 /DNA_ORIENTATION=-
MRRSPRGGLVVLGLAAAFVGLQTAFLPPLDSVTLQRRAILAALWLPFQAASEARALGETSKAAPLVNFNIGDKGFTEYTVGDTFKVSMPNTFKLLKESPAKVIWQGDRLGPLNRMSAAIKEVPADNLAEALKEEPGISVKELGKRLADKREKEGADFYGVLQLEDRDAYRFEFVTEEMHEYVLYSLLKKDGKNLLCSLNVLAPGLLWTNNNRYITLGKIIDSFKPI